MAWQDGCVSWSSRIAASRADHNLHDVVFSLNGEKVSAMKLVLAMASPVFNTQFYGGQLLEPKAGEPVEITDGTPEGFKAMLDFIYNEQEYTIKDLLGEKEKIDSVEDLKTVMDLAYFGHKYQVNAILSFCRNLLKNISYTVDNVVQIYSGIHNYKTTFDTEYGIVAHFMFNFIDDNFAQIFKDGQVTENTFVEEKLMVEILARPSLANVTEGDVMHVALNYVKYLQKDERDNSDNVDDPWKEAARRIISKAIDFTKLSMKELDLTGSYKILPEDIKLWILHEMINNNKHRLVESVKRSGVLKTYKMMTYNNRPNRHNNRNKTNIKIKVNKDSLLQLNRSRLTSCSTYFKKLVWKPFGGITESYEGTAVDGARMFAPANTEITLEVEMTEMCRQLDPVNMRNGKIPNGGPQMVVLELNGKSIEEAIAFNGGVFIDYLTFTPIKN